MEVHKLYTHTHMNRKDSEITPEVCQIVAIRELSASQFQYFRTHLLEDDDFISDFSEELHGSDHDGTRCLLALGEGYPYGILVNSEGYNYARYSGVMPHARQMVESHLKDMTDYCVKEGITHSEDGSWTISFDELYEHFGTEIKPNNGWGEMLLEKVKQQAEVDEIITTEDEFEIQYHLENCPECQQGGIEGAMSLMSLIGCNLLDVHLQNDEGDGTKCFIPELDHTTLSEEGNREFADVLSARVLMMRDGTITIQGISSERIKHFSDVLCQNCTMEDYYKFVAPKSGEIRTQYHTVDQDDIDIASAKHTLWRLGQTEGVQAVFSHCDFYKLNFDRKDFISAVFEDCRFYGCTAKQSEFCFASFERSKFNDCMFEDAYIEEADFRQTDMLSSSFKYSELSGSDFTDARFEGVNLDNARMWNCNFAGTDFRNTDIDDVDTKGSVYSQEEWDSKWGQDITQ